MATQSYQSQLEEVQAAITAVMSGQSYSISGSDGQSFTVTKANLKDLMERELFLRRQVDREARGGIRIRGASPV